VERTIDKVTIECVRGDITRQAGFDAVINAANAWLKPGGGVAGAIHRAAGPELAEECRKLEPIAPGQAVITRGYALPNPFVIHCLGPVFGRDEPSGVLLGDCYRNALALAEKHGLTSVAFPAISTGVFGYPAGDAALIALRAVISLAPGLASVTVIRFVLHDEPMLRIHEETLEALLAPDKTS